MDKTKLSEGVDATVDGPFRIIRLNDQWYVVGRGFTVHCGSEKRARETMEKLRTLWE